LKKGSIEDYYPEKRIVEALRSEYGLEVADNEVKEQLKPPRADSIEKFLVSKGIDTKGWKVVLGRNIASKMTKEEVDDEILGILERLRTMSSRHT